MPRDITPPAAGAPDQYVQRLYKIIPAEISAAYIAVSSLVTPLRSSGDMYLLVSFIVLLIALPFYLKFVQAVKNNLQIAISTLAFPIWAANISAIPLSEDLHRWGFNVSPIAFGVALILWTAISPLLVR